MRDITTNEDNQNHVNKPKPKTTRPKPVYLWTTTDVQKWFRRHCSDFYTVYSDLIAQVVNSNDFVGYNCLMIILLNFPLTAWDLWQSFVAHE